MSNPFVPIEDLAKHFTVSVSTARGWVRQGMIPKEAYIKLGGTYRFNIEKVVECLTKQPPEETEQPAPVEDAQEEVAAPVQLELDFNDPDKDI